jgi:hypothetical protein
MKTITVFFLILFTAFFAALFLKNGYLTVLIYGIGFILIAISSVLIKDDVTDPRHWSNSRSGRLSHHIGLAVISIVGIISTIIGIAGIL